jgi:transposase
VDAAKVLQCVERGLDAMVANRSVSVDGLIPVLNIDGARTNTTKPVGFINPSQMNLSDGGANRVAMDGIGVKGLKTVLEENGKWARKMTKVEAEELLWQSKMVQKQLTEIELMCKRRNIACTYNPKAHPWFAPVEKWWRYSKCLLENSANYEEMKVGYQSLVKLSLNHNPEIVSKCENWFNLSLKYAEYYARGGSDIIREHEMKRRDLSDMPPPGARYRFRDIKTLFEDIHNINWILIRGKYYQEVQEYW